MPGNVFWPWDERRETKTSCENWNDYKKMQQGKTSSTSVGWTSKVAQIRMSDRSAENDMG